MKDQYTLYQRQYNNAMRTIDRLRKKEAEIDFKLKSNPICPHLHKDLRTVNLDITITLNEIEHLESHLFEYNS
ncbi:MULTISPECIES: hypothetical protein [Flavobacterium]|uniref:hypothetical protein n=1 Tax=Flavobacterium TaxID=237 RepID=UPI00188B996B|nr:MULTISPECIES: hypothetical protein [Flavobacterium]MBF4470886.1 hypothetical protein [Flavobacterium sp. HJJ]